MRGGEEVREEEGERGREKRDMRENGEKQQRERERERERESINACVVSVYNTTKLICSEVRETLSCSHNKY